MKTLRAFTLTGAVIVAVGSVVLASWNGLLAASIGAIGTALYLGATWLLVKLVGSASKGDRIDARRALFSALAVMLKLPLIYFGWKLSEALGPFGPTCFLAGLALVYSLLIWRAALAVRD